MLTEKKTHFGKKRFGFLLQSWQPEFVTIIVTLDSVQNSCKIYLIRIVWRKNLAKSFIKILAKFIKILAKFIKILAKFIGSEWIDELTISAVFIGQRLVNSILYMFLNFSPQTILSLSFHKEFFPRFRFGQEFVFGGGTATEEGKEKKYVSHWKPWSRLLFACLWEDFMWIFNVATLHFKVATLQHWPRLSFTAPPNPPMILIFGHDITFF